MNLREHYATQIRSILEEHTVFHVNLPLHRKDASTNVAIIIANNKGINVSDCVRDLCNQLHSMRSFRDIDSTDSGIIRWNIPMNLWIHQLVSLSQIKNIFSDYSNLYFDDSLLFDLRYVYTRIWSVFKRSDKLFDINDDWFLLNKDYNLPLRSDVAKLVKFATRWLLSIVEKSVSIEMWREFSKKFNVSWMSGRIGDEMSFISLLNEQETKFHLAFLKILSNTLEQLFVVLKIKLGKELV